MKIKQGTRHPLTTESRGRNSVLYLFGHHVLASLILIGHYQICLDIIIIMLSLALYVLSLNSQHVMFRIIFDHMPRKKV